jgi:hypothetical protein
MGQTDLRHIFSSFLRKSWPLFGMIRGRDPYNNAKITVCLNPILWPGLRSAFGHLP